MIKENQKKIIDGMNALFKNYQKPNSVEIKGYTDALGTYDFLSVMEACRYFSNNRHEYQIAHNRWPYVGELQDLFKRWGTKPSVFDNVALPSPDVEDFNNLCNEFEQWYGNWIVKWPDFEGVNIKKCLCRADNFNMRVKNFWMNEDELKKKNPDADFSTKAVLFYKNGGCADFETYLMEGENPPPLKDPLAYINDKLNKKDK